MTAPEPIDWQEWRAKPVVVRMAPFGGFEDGNGHALLGWLEDRGINSVRDGEDILLVAQERDDARAEPGCWFVIGTRNEVYPINPDVQADKYELPGALIERLTARFGIDLAEEIAAVLAEGTTP